MKHKHKWELAKYSDKHFDKNGSVFPSQGVYVCICGKRKIVVYEP